MMSPDEPTSMVERFPRVRVANTPTPTEHLVNSGADLDISLSVKRDDYIGDRIFVWLTGGQPALFGYVDQLAPVSRADGGDG